MPELQSLAVYDGETTPILHTFVPTFPGNSQGVVRLKESDGVPLGDNILTLSLRQTDTKYKGRVLLVMPIVVDETINGVVVPRVVRSAIADVTLTFDQTSSAQERENVMTLMGNILLGNQVLISGAFHDLEGIY
jgi:hypothetical protein